MFRLSVFHNADAAASHQEVDLEDQVENLIQLNQQPLVLSPPQEALLQNPIEVGTMQLDQLLKEVNLSHLCFEVGPLGLDHGHHDVLVEGPDEVLHLLAEELETAKFPELPGGNPLNKRIAI